MVRSSDVQGATAQPPRAEPAGDVLEGLDGRSRVVIENVSPAVDGGRFPIKRVVGERVQVRADIFADGHDLLSAAVKYRHLDERAWSEAPMQPGINDSWTGTFTVERLGIYLYTVEAWVNRFRSWQRDLEKKSAAGADVAVELLAGAQMVQAALERAEGPEHAELAAAAEQLGEASPLPLAERVQMGVSRRLAAWMDTFSERLHAARAEREFRAVVDPVLAGFGAWYELFPRSCAPVAGRHGTFADLREQLPKIAEMGFDVVYLPPIHPIGRAYRKGRNNTLEVTPDDPGSPWAIGGPEGGHKAIHPQLGTLEDFRALVGEARRLRLEVALDMAFQCSPDHPYVREHPQWFRHRADGSIQYAENPPKKYQDIVPLDFETDDWPALWRELKSIFEFWMEQGVRVFRVDNPHTKPFRFWEWCLAELKQADPGLIFLSEAFTRPKIMHRLAKLGFTQSYNYFPWRNSKPELTAYLTELTRTSVREFLRPNLWPNTPDILTQYLQYGGRPAFMSRLVLAATLGASYGIYGPPFENCEHTAREQGSEEYLNSEKYEVRHWEPDLPDNLRGLIGRLNRIRRENPALHRNDSLEFHEVDNDQLIAYSKHSEDLENVILTVVNLDPRHTQRGWLNLALEHWGLPPTGTYQVHELLTEERYLWAGTRNYVELNPLFVPAHVFRLRRHVRTEQDFDYFL